MKNDVWSSAECAGCLERRVWQGFDKKTRHAMHHPKVGAADLFAHSVVPGHVGWLGCGLMAYGLLGCGALAEDLGVTWCLDSVYLGSFGYLT